MRWRYLAPVMEENVKKFLRPLMLVPLLLVMGSYEDCQPVPPRQSTPKAVTPICQGRTCNQVVHITVANTLCVPVNGSGEPAESINVLVGTRVCWINDTNCEVTLRFNTELFDQWVTLGPGECANKTVLSTARGQTYTYSIGGDCCATGSGHGNPEVIVGEDDEGGD